MMSWYQAVSCLFTNEIRLLLGVCLAARLMDFLPERKILLLSGMGGALVSLLQAASLPAAAVTAVEILIITAVSWYHLSEKGKGRYSLFLAFFYEIGAGLWDFLAQAVLGILFRSEDFVSPYTPEYLAGIWLVRLGMLGIALFLTGQKKDPAAAMRIASLLVLLGFFGTVTLSQQRILPLNEDQTGTWIILSMVLLFALLLYRVNRQREMEAEIARLKQEQAEITERDYQALQRTYGANAKLYHDLHNHIEAIYQCLVQGDTREAIRYCEDLRSPVEEISQAAWTGDKAVDCLISSKIAMAGQEQVRTKVNIEFPRNTNIRSVDLTAILGNLLDNALEAAKAAPEPLRFLNLTIRRINAMLIIKVENGYASPPVQEDGKLRTSKPDKAFHGWGLKSVQTAADRYDGTVGTVYEDGVFCAVVTLSFSPIMT